MDAVGGGKRLLGRHDSDDSINVNANEDERVLEAVLPFRAARSLTRGVTSTEEGCFLTHPLDGDRDEKRKNLPTRSH